ncbi:Ppx/GppA phosphatase family protein [Hyphomicrobium sulfonivorans]|uniref:Ppx/GppA phosphatase family protein n=1 Tax=Hyphomicrobium sulfonivorans TaxID=121290 RepID=UPI0008398F6B|nr:Ppx/GppA phosphatase family protein [Hyphomicrobium sulfonivorans]
MTSLERLFGTNRRARETEPVGVVDIGSNSVRLVVYEGAVRSPTPVCNEKVLCGLGRSIASTGRLGTEAVERTIAALGRFRAIARLLGVKHLHAFATAAVREAEDGKDFITRAEKTLGTSIEVISGEREARLVAQGIIMGFTNPDGIAGDLGGGSLELIDISAEELKHASTLPIGGLRLIDATGNKIEKAQPLIDAAIAEVPWLAVGAGRTFFPVGGSWRAIARLHMEQTRYPLHVTHGYSIPTAEAIAFCEFLRKTKKLTGLAGFSLLPKIRREVLPFAAFALERLLRTLNPSEVMFSAFGVREGLIYSLLPAHERQLDPLLSFCAEYAGLRSRSVEQAWELCKWTDPLFDPPGPKETPEERRLRYAACLISDIAWREHPDYRGEQSLNLLAHAGLSGIDHQGRVFMALAIFFRHVGASQEHAADLSERLKALASKRSLKRARIVAAAIRTAHTLSIGTPGVIDKTSLAYESDKLVLTIPKSYAALDGERLRRRFEILAQLVEKQPEIRLK